MAAPFVAPNFNPLHREGGDRYILRTQSGQPRFQSTPPRGWRLEHYSDVAILYQFQSTPPRGWRLYFIFFIFHLRHFNPLHREGGDGTQTGGVFPACKFQSTPPRGWRQKYYTITTTILHHISTNKSYPTPLKSRPTIPAHSQIRSHCANFPVRIPP